jgi:hypothetical protein
MNYRAYLMQMAQRGKVIKTGGTLRIMNKQPYTKRSFSGSSGVYSGGTIKKLILDRLDNGIEPLTTSVSTLTIGKKYRKKSSKKASKKASKKGGSMKRKSSKRKSSKRKSSKRKASKKASKRKSSKKSGGRVARKKRSFRPIKFKL